MWTMDYLGKNWIDSKSAYWTFGVQSPMGYGYSASSVKSTKSITFDALSSNIRDIRMKKRNHSLKKKK